MSIRPTDLPVNLPREVTGIRRVERDSETQGFGQKEKPDHESGKDNAQHEDPPVTVEVSDEYLASAKGGEGETDPEDSAMADIQDSDPHLDIHA
jgi:hypothetical protein